MDKKPDPSSSSGVNGNSKSMDNTTPSSQKKDGVSKVDGKNPLVGGMPNLVDFLKNFNPDKK